MFDIVTRALTWSWNCMQMCTFSQISFWYWFGAVRYSRPISIW